MLRASTELALREAAAEMRRLRESGVAVERASFAWSASWRSLYDPVPIGEVRLEIPGETIVIVGMEDENG